jgi:hypothetical protein
MRLAANLLQKIVGRPVDHFAGSGHQRALGRIEVQKSATIYPIRDAILEDAIFVSVRDVSAETIGLSSSVAMMPFSSLIVKIPLPDSQMIAVRCRVTRCTRAFGPQFSIVAQFEALLDPQTLQETVGGLSP